MIFWASAIAAAGMQLAQPQGHPGGWLTDNDYPIKAKNRNARGQTRFRLIVGPDGKPTRCDIVVSSGHDDLDQQTCTVMMRRSNFSPAKSADGQPIYGTFTSSAIWILPGMKQVPMESLSDLALTVSALPKAIKKPAKVRVGLLVRSDGTVQECTPRREDKNAILLGPVACQQAMILTKTGPIMDAQNNPTLSVQDLEVSFSTTR